MLCLYLSHLESLDNHASELGFCLHSRLRVSCALNVQKTDLRLVNLRDFTALALSQPSHPYTKVKQFQVFFFSFFKSHSTKESQRFFGRHQRRDRQTDRQTDRRMFQKVYI